MELPADHKQVIFMGLLIFISWNKHRNLIRKYFMFVKNAAKIQYIYVPESLKMAQNCSRSI